MAAYKLTISSMMPTIAYLTLLDKYIVACSLILILAVLQNGLAGLENIAEDMDIFDSASIWGLFGVWVGTHIFFAAWAWRTFKKRRELHNEHNSGESVVAMVARPLKKLASRASFSRSIQDSVSGTSSRDTTGCVGV